jgi:hypothetical protein
LLVVLLDGIVVILALVLNPRVKRRRAMERVLDQEAGVSSATMLTGGKGGHAALPTPAIPVEEGQQPDPAVEDRSEKGADALGEIPEARESEVSRPLKYPDIETA